MEKASTHSPIKIFTWACGKTINFIMMDSISTITQKNIMANLQKAKKMEEEYIIIKVELSMMDNGTKIEKMDLELIFM
jgi:hypothetical protein